MKKGLPLDDCLSKKGFQTVSKQGPARSKAFNCFEKTKLHSCEGCTSRFYDAYSGS